MQTLDIGGYAEDRRARIGDASGHDSRDNDIGREFAHHRDGADGITGRQQEDLRAGADEGLYQLVLLRHVSGLWYALDDFSDTELRRGVRRGAFHLCKIGVRTAADAGGLFSLL